MLESMRKNAHSTILYVVFGVLIFVFIFSFGSAGNSCRSGSMATDHLTAAKVNGTEIRMAEFDQAYGARFRELSSQMGGGGGDIEALVRQLGIKGQTLNTMIDRELVSQMATASGLKVSDQELSEQIAKMPEFQTEGVFDPAVYQAALERQRDFEQDLRKRMLLQKFVASVTSSAQVSDDEVKSDFVRQHEKLELDFVRFSPALFKAEATAPTEAQVDAFLKGSSAKVEEYFKVHAFQFSPPKRMHLRQIFVKGAEGDAAVKAKVDELYKKATAPGADFAAIAKESSEDQGTRDSGGDLGTVAANTLPNFAQRQVSALNPNEVSPPLVTPNGWYLYKAEQIFPSVKPEFKDVQKDVAKAMLAEDGAKMLAQAKAEAVLAEVKGGKKLSDLYAKPPAPSEGDHAAAPKGPFLENSGPVSLGATNLPTLGTAPDLMHDAAALTEEKPVPGKVYEVNGSFVVATLQHREHADMEQLTRSMDDLREDLRARKGDEALVTLIDAARAKASISKNQSLIASEPLPGMPQ